MCIPQKRYSCYWEFISIDIYRGEVDVFDAVLIHNEHEEHDQHIAIVAQTRTTTFTTSFALLFRCPAHLMVMIHDTILTCYLS